MKKVVFSLGLLPSLNSLKTYANENKENKIKICLAMTYTAQVDFYNKNKKYANNLAELNLNKSASELCNDIQLDFSKVDANSFSALHWSIDNKKNIIQLK